MFNELQMAHHDKKNLQDEVETLKFHERSFIREMKEVEEEKNKLNIRLNSLEQECPFWLVLVDGDNTLVRPSTPRWTHWGYTAR